MNATLTEPMNAAGKLAAVFDEYVGLLAAKAKSEGLSNADEQRLRALAKEPLIARDLKRDQSTAAGLWLFKRDVSATLPAADPTPAELEALAQAAVAAERDRMRAIVDVEVYKYRDERCRAYHVAERSSSDHVDAMRKMKEAQGAKLAAHNAAQAALRIARETPRARALAAEFPELAAALGLTIEPPATKRRKSV